jgi:hypothetical protein
MFFGKALTDELVEAVTPKPILGHEKDKPTSIAMVRDK